MPKGCLDKKAALVVMDKDPVNLDRAHQYVRLKKTQEDLIDVKASLMQILVLLRSQNPDNRQRSPPRKVSPRRSPVRKCDCYNCGEPGHFSAECGPKQM